MSNTEFSPIPHADRAMMLYGHPFHAAKIIERQFYALLGAAEGKYKDALYRLEGRTTQVIETLKMRAMGRQDKFDLWGHRRIEEYDVESHISYLVPLTPAGSLVLCQDEQSELDAMIDAENARLNKLVKFTFKYSGKQREGYVTTQEWESTSKHGTIYVLDADGNPLLNARKVQIAIQKRQARYVWESEETENEIQAA